jgi:serine/threonine-protein kinase
MPSEVTRDVAPVGSPAGSTLATGQLVADTYRIVRRIGAGGMGEIYEATHERLSGRYAMKVLKPEVATTTEALARFQREAKVTSALRHPNIVNVVDFSTLPTSGPFMVMEYLDGEELADVMKRERPMPVPRVVSIVRQIASGLTAAHEKNVVHRDLKPQNVFVMPVVGEEEPLIKIVDFGISKVKDLAAKLTNTSTVLGTVQYMSPEQARGRVSEIDARTDQFALAAIVYEMLTGEEAFVGESVSSILYQIVHEEPAGLVDGRRPIPAPIAAVLRRGLAKDKERRFPDVMAFARALDDAATARPAAAPPVSPRKRGVWLGLAIVGLGIVVVGAGAGLRGARRQPPVAIEAGQRPAAPTATPSPAMAPAARQPAAQTARLESPPTLPARRAPPSRPTTKVARRLLPEAPKAPAPDCEPNFTVDERGDKHFKPECFLTP